MLYEEKFIQGITSEGDPLPKDWKKSAKLLDILSLLSILKSETSIDRPNLIQDINTLLKYTITNWNQF